MSDKALVIAHLHPFLPSDRVTKEYAEGTTIDAILRELQPVGVVFVAVNGERITDFSATVNGKDHVVVKVIPAGGGSGESVGSAAIRIIAGTTAIFAGLLLAIPSGGASLGLVVFGAAALFAPKIVDTLSQTFANAAGVNAAAGDVYGVSGGSNGENKWGKVPVIFGKHLVVPPYAAKSWTEIATSSGGTDGDTQYVHLMYCIGLGPAKISSLKFGDTLLSPNASAVKNGAITDIVNFSDVSIQVYDDGTSPSLYPNTVIEDRVDTVLKYNAEKVITTAKNIDKFSVDVSFPSGLYSYSTNGARTNRTVHLEARYRVAGSGTAWASMTLMPYFSGSDHEVTKGNAEVLRYSSAVTGLTPSASTAYEIIVKRLNADMTETDKGADTIRWDVVRSERTTERPVLAATAAKLCIVAMKIKASDSISGTVDRFSCIVEPQNSVYDGSGSGSAEWVAGYSQNPAVAFLAALRGNMNPRPIANANIDWPRLESWFTTCNTKGWTCNAVAGSGERLFDTLSKIAATGRAKPLIRDGKYSVVVDEAKTTVVQHFTPRNSSGFTWSKAFQDYPHALRVSFISEDDDYSQVDRIVCDTGYTEATATEFQKSSMWGVTDPDLIYKHGWYQIAVSRSRAEVYSFDTSAESIVCELGDLIVCTHDVPMFGMHSARVKAVTLDGGGNATAITVDEEITQEALKTYAVRFRRAVDNTSVLATLSTVPGAGHELTFASPVSAATIPAVDDLVLFGESGSESVRLIVAGIEPGENMEAKIYAVDEAPGVHTADTGTIPAWDAHISKPANFGVNEAVSAGVARSVATIQPAPFPITKALSTLSDAVDFDGQYGIYKGRRYVGTVPSTWTSDDTTPIYLNSLATPGAFDGQTGEYLGVRYVWSENSLYPATGLYPALGLYPSHSGQWIMEDAAYAQSVALQAIATDLQAQLDRQLTIYVQNSDPRNNVPSPWAGVGTDGSHTGDLWYDMTVGSQVTKRWSGTAWVVVEDAVLTAALARIASLESAADGTVTVYGERPEVGPYQVGDFWYDLTTPTDPHLYVATVSRLEGVTGSLADWALTSISNPTWTSRTTAENSGRLKVGDELYENGARYRCSFAGVRLFPSENLYPASGLYPSGYAWERISPISWGVLASEPLVGMIAFDTYFNSTDSKGYYYTGTAWAASTTALATQDYADAIANDLQDQVDGKIAAFWQATAPTSGMETDDLWFDTDNGNRAYRYNGTGWVDAQDSDIAAGIAAAATAQATADGKTAVFATLVLAQANAQIGDLFLDASLLYRATVAGASITLANSTRLTTKIYSDVADATALAALTGMIRGDTVYMTSTKQWYKYTTAWETDGVPQLGTGDISTYTPRYLSALSALSGTYHPGDYFLCATSFSSFTKGLIYKYSGSSWAEDTDSGHKMIAMDDLLDIAEAATDAAVIFGKKIVALELVVRELFAQAATIQSLTVADLSVVDITAGDCKINVKSLSLTDDDLVSEAPQFNWVVQAPGTIRVGCSLLARIGIRTFGYDSTTTFYLYRTRSGTETLLGSYARGNWGGTNAGSFTADITVEVGDIISLKVLQSNLLATASIGLDTYSPLALVV